MKRGNLAALPLALFCLALGACARLSTPHVKATTADDRIAISVLADAVYLVDPGTGERTVLVGGLADFQSGYAVWATDRSRLAYGSDGIFVRDLKTGEDSALVRGTMLSMPAWSPDGRYIAYGNGSALWIAAAQPGARAEQLPIPATLAPLGMDWGAHSIVFEGLARDCERAFDCPSTDQSEIWVVNPDATGLRQLTHVGHAERPKWSPDGTQILFLRRAPDNVDEPRQLWVINAGGSAPRRVLGTDGVVAADWSPDGRLIAMARAGSTGGMLQLWIARSDGSNAHPVGSALAGTEATIDW